MAMMKDGHPTILVNIGGGEGVLFHERRVKPPSIDGRPAIDISGMRNNAHVTTWPRALKAFGDVTAVVMWDPLYWNTVANLINGGSGDLGRTPRFMQLRYPGHSGGAVHNFYGTINKFEPNEHTEGELPTANMTMSIHGVNPAGVETSPSVSLP